MKCEIIRDLLPSYLDGLTSEESNLEIAAHLQGCPGCQTVVDSMRAELATPPPPCDPDAIWPLKKLRLRLILTVIATALACALAAFGAFFAFGLGQQVDSSEILIETSMQDGFLTLDFTLAGGGVLNAINRVEGAGSARVIEFRRCLPFALDDRGSEPHRYSWGIQTLDADGNPLPLPENDTLVLRFRDRSEVLSLAELIRETR